MCHRTLPTLRKWWICDAFVLFHIYLLTYTNLSAKYSRHNSVRCNLLGPLTCGFIAYPQVDWRVILYHVWAGLLSHLRRYAICFHVKKHLDKYWYSLIHVLCGFKTIYAITHIFLNWSQIGLLPAHLPFTAKNIPFSFSDVFAGRCICFEIIQLIYAKWLYPISQTAYSSNRRKAPEQTGGNQKPCELGTQKPLVVW